MLCLSGFELYSRWVPLFVALVGFGRRQLKSRRRTPSIVGGPYFQKCLVKVYSGAIVLNRL